MIISVVLYLPLIPKVMQKKNKRFIVGILTPGATVLRSDALGYSFCSYLEI